MMESGATLKLPSSASNKPPAFSSAGCRAGSPASSATRSAHCLKPGIQVASKSRSVPSFAKTIRSTSRVPLRESQPTIVLLPRERGDQYCTVTRGPVRVHVAANTTIRVHLPPRGTASKPVRGHMQADAQNTYISQLRVLGRRARGTRDAHRRTPQTNATCTAARRERYGGAYRPTVQPNGRTVQVRAIIDFPGHPPRPQGPWTPSFRAPRTARSLGHDASPGGRRF